MGNLLNKIEDIPKNKKLIVFDLDGTLTKSKMDMDEEMVTLLDKLLQVKKVAVIGGGKFELFQKQVVSRLFASKELLANLFLFPMTATVFYKYDGNSWVEVYNFKFSEEEKNKILSGFDKMFKELDYQHPENIYGELIEDRGSQITFSVFGQKAPLELKEKWSKSDLDIRPQMEKVLQKHLPDMEVKIAGLTSIDVTRKGVDKNYGIKQMSKYLDVPFEDVLFVGDNFIHKGNDEPVLATGALCFEVKNIQDTKKLIGHLLSN